MEKIIAGRHLEVSDGIKDYIMMELGKIEEDYHKLTSARVVLDVQRSLYSAEIILHGKNLSIEAKGQSNQIRPSISSAIDKTKRQLKKHLSKVQNHHTH